MTDKIVQPLGSIFKSSIQLDQQLPIYVSRGEYAGTGVLEESVRYTGFRFTTLYRCSGLVENSTNKGNHN